jgi:hypothetical protein
MTGKRDVRHSSAGRDRMRREVRYSDAGKEKTGGGSQVQRKSRGGQDSHPSGNYVRNPARHLAPEVEVEHASPREKPPVSVPKLKFLERKLIAGEWL